MSDATKSPWEPTPEGYRVWSEAVQRCVLWAATNNRERTREAKEVIRLAAASPELRDCLQAFVTFHGGHVLPPELQAVQARARAVLDAVEGATE